MNSTFGCHFRLKRDDFSSNRHRASSYCSPRKRHTGFLADALSEGPEAISHGLGPPALLYVKLSTTLGCMQARRIGRRRHNGAAEASWKSGNGAKYIDIGRRG